LFGKYLNGYSSYANQLGKSGYVPPGWDNWEAFYGMNGAYYNYKLDVNGQLINYGHAPQDYSTDVIGQRLREWLDTSDGDGRNPSQPFFAYVAAFSPHAPTDASITHGDTHRFLNLPPFRSPALNERDVSDKPSYIRALPPINPLGMERLTNVWRQQHQSLFSYDRQIGLTLKLLRTEHQLRNTLVIVMSDNGETTGEHRWTYKLVPYERSIRVPLAIRYDRLIRHPGTTDSRDLVANADLFPTIASVALGPRWRPPQPVDGLSLRNVLNGTQHGQLRRSIVLENEYYARGGLKRNVPTYCGIVTRRWKYVVYSPTSKDPGLVAGSEEDELYDLEHDPFELHNLAASRPGIAARLRKRLAKACSPTPPGWDVRW
jgi:arylsulfatase A-like enzyme